MRDILQVLAGVLFVLGLADAVGAAPPVGAANVSTDGGPTRHASIDQSFGKMPLYFVENRGQLDPRVSYYVAGKGATVYLTSRGFTFALIDAQATPARERSDVAKASLASPGAPGESAPPPAARRWTVDLDLVGARGGVRAEGQGRTDVLFYQVLSACGPSGADEGPVCAAATPCP
jgi:hypothetical protein